MCFSGKNCKVDDVIIKYGEYKVVGNKLCTCAGDWFPNAFCSSLKILNHVKASQKSHCVADISDFSLW